MAVNDVVKLIFHFKHGTQQMRPGIHLQATVGGLTLQSIIDDFQAVVEPAMLATMAPQLFLEAYECQDVMPGLLATVIEVLPTPKPGTAVGTILPPQDAVLFSLKSALKSPRSRGRVFWPGVTEEQQQDGLLTTAANASWTTLLGTLRNAYIGDTTTSGWRLVNFSKEELDPPKPPPTFKPRPGNVITPVSLITLDPIIRSQRRRQVGVGQ